MAVLRRLDADLHLDALTVTGRPLRDCVRSAEIKDASVIRPKDSPYMAEGGTPILFNEITIDIPNRRLDARVDFAARTPQAALPREIPPGYMRRYVKHVSSAARGAVLE